MELKEFLVGRVRQAKPGIYDRPSAGYRSPSPPDRRSAASLSQARAASIDLFPGQSNLIHAQGMEPSASSLPLSFPKRDAPAPRDTTIAKFRDDNRRREQYLKEKLVNILKLNLFYDIDEALSTAGGILTYVYQIIKEKGSSLDEIFEKIQDVARGPNYMEYFGAATTASGPAGAAAVDPGPSYFISLATNAVITPFTLLPLKAGIAGTVSAVRKRSAISMERADLEKRNRLLASFERDLNGLNCRYPRRMVEMNNCRIGHLDFGARQNMLGLQFALWTIASAFLIEAKSSISYAYQKRTLNHRSPQDLAVANYAGLITNMFATASVGLGLYMMASRMDAKNRHAAEGIGDRRAILDNSGADDGMARFAARHLDESEAYLRPDLARGDMTEGRYRLTQAADALKFRFKSQFGRENRQLKVASLSLLGFSFMNLAAGFGETMGLALLSNKNVLQAGFVLGSINALYASMKSLSCYVHGHHGQQDREEWLNGDFALLDRPFQMLMDAVGHDGAALRDKIRRNIEGDAALRGDMFEMTEGRCSNLRDLKRRLREPENLADSLVWLAKFADNRIPVLEAAREARRAVGADMDGPDGLPYETDDMPPPRQDLLRSIRKANGFGLSQSEDMLDRAYRVRDAMKDKKLIGSLDILGLQAVAHEFLRVQNHESQCVPPIHLADTTEALVRFVDPHRAGHADEDKLGILAEAHISALAVTPRESPPVVSAARAKPRPLSSNNPFLPDAHPEASAPRQSMIGTAI